MKQFKTFIIALVSLYIASAFVTWEWNITEWHGIYRFFLLCVTFGVTASLEPYNQK